MSSKTLRPDLQVVADMVAPGASVLDVGCGEGELLAWLMAHKQVRGRGMELSQEGVNRCVAKGLAVIQGDADEDLRYYPDKAVDFVILSQTLQTLRDPRGVLCELVRIGRHAIVSVPNFGHWKNRLYFTVRGRMPVTRRLSYQWYDTPNIHFCTINDFMALCEKENLMIEQRRWVDAEGRIGAFRRKSVLANILGEQGIFMVKKNSEIV